jgi:hypothetical protein
MDRVIFRHLLAAFCGLSLASTVAAQQPPPAGPWNAAVPGAAVGALPGPGMGNNLPGPIGPLGGNPYGGSPAIPGPAPGFDAAYPAIHMPQPGWHEDPSLYQPPTWAPMPQYRTANAKPPQSLKEYRPSIPGGLDTKRFASGPMGSIRDYPYLRRTATSEHYVTPPGMEMPDQVPGNAAPLTWRDRLRRVLFPLGDPLGLLR